MPPNEIRVSASRLKSIGKCSFSFYNIEVEKVPEDTHPKTHMGSLAHSILECLTRKRHKKKYKKILKDGTINKIPALVRMRRKWQERYNIADEIMVDLDGCVMTGLLHTNYEAKGAIKVFEPEWEFRLEGKDYVGKGFVDRMYEEPEEFVLVDYKTMGTKFTTEAEMLKEFDIQATIYQVAIWKYFKKRARVEFYLLRYPPTEKKPNQHKRVIPAKIEMELFGFEVYMEHMGKYFTHFNYEDAKSNFLAANPKKIGFCNYVCKMKNPFSYWVILDSKDKIVKSSRSEINICNENQKIEKREYLGCFWFYKNDGTRRMKSFE